MNTPDLPDWNKEDYIHTPPPSDAPQWLRNLFLLCWYGTLILALMGIPMAIKMWCQVHWLGYGLILMVLLAIPGGAIWLDSRK